MVGSVDHVDETGGRGIKSHAPAKQTYLSYTSTSSICSDVAVRTAPT